MKFKDPKSKFVKLRCNKCKNEQIIFEGATTPVKCLICENIIAEPKGGKAEVKARIIEVLN